MAKIFHAREQVTRGILEVGLDDIPFVAYGDLAKNAAAMMAGSLVQCSGKLTQQRWGVKGAQREQWTLELETMKNNGRSEEKWTPPA